MGNDLFGTVSKMADADTAKRLFILLAYGKSQCRPAWHVRTCISISVRNGMSTCLATPNRAAINSHSFRTWDTISMVLISLQKACELDKLPGPEWIRTILWTNVTIAQMNRSIFGVLMNITDGLSTSLNWERTRKPQGPTESVIFPYGVVQWSNSDLKPWW